MNNLLSLKGNLYSAPKAPGGGKAKFYNIEKGVSSEMIQKVIDEASSILSWWKENRNYIKNCLVLETCIDVLPKSRRNKTLFKDENNQVHIVGAKFVELEDETKVHGVIYLTTLEKIKETISDLKEVQRFVDENYDGYFTQKDLDFIQEKMCKLPNKSVLKNYLVDISNARSFSVPTFDDKDKLSKSNLINFYNTGDNIKTILDKVGVKDYEYNIVRYFDDYAYVLSKESALKLADEVGYLISMSTTDLLTLLPEEYEEVETKEMFIEDPKSEPTIGVIDTLFDQRAYFSKWVEYHDMVDKNIPGHDEAESKFHGTSVDSIIVDGCSLNPKLDDNCGHFKVRHFGVGTNKYISRSNIIKLIDKIVRDNQDIHVWNLSLGLNLEVSDNFISPEAALLDQLQSKYKNIIFVVCGTNDKAKNAKPGRIKIGAPADSLNSVVVNSVNFNKEPSIFTRRGEVLSFFIKPDISYYGGDYNDMINVYNGFSVVKMCGTSFAAPFIARKLCYMIDVLGLPREIAKALLIDSASKWDAQSNKETMQLKGYGVVPIKIDDVIKCNNNEIRFFIKGNANTYSTYSYNIPVPSDKEDQTMYVARAVLCYFPTCSREQGVDYTDTELDLSFGKLKRTIDGETKLDTINRNIQDEEKTSLKEKDAREQFRKRDNVKRISEKLPTNKPQYRQAIQGKWGFNVRIKERNNDTYKRGLPFGLVITLYEKNMKNKQDEFIKNCQANGWLVEEINIENKIDVYNVAQEEIEFD